MIKGLLTCKPKNAPKAGEVRSYVIIDMTTYNKVKSPPQGESGRNYKVVSASQTDYKDSHGNISFNVELEPTDSPTTPQSSGNAPRNAQADDPRHYMMRAANLLKLAHSAAKSIFGEDYDHEDGRTLFIQACRDGYVHAMPDRPEKEPEPEHKEQPF